MSVRIKLLLFLIMVVVTLGGLGFNLIKMNDDAYQKEQFITETTNAAIELSFQAKVSFSSQVHSWKNILLRGYSDTNYHSYLQDFYQYERSTRKAIKQLDEYLADYPQSQSLISALQYSHKELGHKFREALRTFNETDIDPGPVTDKFLQGTEDIPKLLLKEIILQLQALRTAKIAELQQQKIDQEQVYFVSIMVILSLLFAFYFWYLDRKIGKPAEQAQLLSNIIKHAETVAKFGTWDWTSRHNQHHWSSGFYEILNLTPSVIADFDAFLVTIHSDDRKRVKEQLEDLRNNFHPFSITARLTANSDVKPRVIELRGQVIKTHKADSNVRMTSIIYDITEHMEVEEKLELYARMFEHTGEAILISDSANKIIKVNDAFQAQMGYGEAEVLGESPDFLASGETPLTTYELMWSELNGNGFWQGEVWNRNKAGHIFPTLAAITCIKNSQGEVENYIANYSDISQIKEAEAHITKLAHHDSLTGLLNRTSLEDRLQQALLSAERKGDKLAVLFLDMDRFKLINDTMGHHAGDEVLIKVARRLTKTLRESDIVARIGGDEFIIVLTDYSDFPALITLANTITTNLSEPYLVEKKRLICTPSIGISVYPEDGKDAETLMKNADAAMYDVKDKGRNSFKLFTQEMNTIVQNRLDLEQDLLHAIEQSHFELYYQPQINDQENCVTGVEALIRWQHPEKGLIAPDLFIPVAEESGLIMPLGSWVITQACKTFDKWRTENGCTIRMAVNISPKQFLAPDFVNQVKSAIEEYNIPLGKLELEITETQAMENPEKIIEILLELKKLNVTIAIDDFGTGYSSLAYLKRLPIDIVKIDRSFVQDIEHDSNDAAISAAAIALSHNLGFKVVAEGVETADQLAFLNTHACDVIQGYYFSRPLPEDEALAFIKSYPNKVPS